MPIVKEKKYNWHIYVYMIKYISVLLRRVLLSNIFLYKYLQYLIIEYTCLRIDEKYMQYQN